MYSEKFVFIVVILFIGTTKTLGVNYNGLMDNAADTSRLGPGFKKQTQTYLDCLIAESNNSLQNLGINLDPFAWSFNQTWFDLGVISGLIALPNLQINGLANANVQEAKLSPQLMPLGARLQLKITWPGINMLTNYISNMTILGRPLNANGNSTGNLTSLGIKINALISPNNAFNNKLQSLSVKPSLDNSQFNLRGITMNNVDLGERLSTVLNQLPQFINTNADYFDQLISPYLTDFVNEQLAVNPNQNHGYKERSIAPVSSSSCQFNLT